MAPKFRTKTERLAWERLGRNLDYLHDERLVDYAIRELIPDAWHTLEQDLDVTEKKVRVTLRLDDSVAKFYRAMGHGYQSRINRILATWAQMKILKLNEMDAEIAEFFRKLGK